MTRLRQPALGLAPTPHIVGTARAGRLGLLRWAVVAAALGGCAELECGVGTHEAEGQCVPNVPVACGAGTTYVRGFCVVEDDTSAPSDALAGGD